MLAVLALTAVLALALAVGSTTWAICARPDWRRRQALLEREVRFWEGEAQAEADMSAELQREWAGAKKQLQVLEDFCGIAGVSSDAPNLAEELRLWSERMTGERRAAMAELRRVADSREALAALAERRQAEKRKRRRKAG